MNRKRIISFLIPYVYSLFFAAAVTAFFWIAINYASFSFVTGIVTVFAAFYAIVAIASFINLGKKNRFLSGSSYDVLSVRTQKAIRAAGLLLALPALFFCGAFAFTALSYNEEDNASIDRVNAMVGLETNLFGSSRIWNYIGLLHPASAGPVCGFTVPDNAQPSPAPAHPPAPTISAQKDVDFGPYMADVQKRIKRAWYPPKSEQCARVVVAFKIHIDGNLSDLKVKDSSGDQYIDRAALASIENSAPFRPLPDGSPPDVDIQYTFDYNVWGAQGHNTSRDTVHSEQPQGDSFSSSSN